MKLLAPIIFLAGAMSLSLAGSALAQDVPATSGVLDVSVSVEAPSPGQAVTITAHSYSIDIAAANIIWVAGGKTIGKGIGFNKVTVNAPASGKRLIVDVTAVSPQGISVQGSAVISSGSVDIVVEPGGYVPPFFHGKAVVAYQETTRFIAMPHVSNSSGTEYDPKTLLYTWSKDNSVLQDQSGYGAQAIAIKGGIVPRPYRISVTVSTRDGSAGSASFLAVEAGSPSISFYRDDPLYGVLYNNALGSTLYLGSSREAAVMAVPYGFNAPTSGLGNLSLSWLINSIKHNELSPNRSITLRAPDGGAGSSDIMLTVNNTEDILQQASIGLKALWNAASGSQN